jgi:blocked-early-in-transport protein 1
MHQRRNGRPPKSADDMYNNLESGRRSAPSSGRGMSSHEPTANIMESQNHDRISELSDQVARLKGLTVDIGNEVRDQNRLLDNMGEGFTSVGDMLAGSLARIGTMLETGGAKHMCYLVGFVVFVMVFLYWLVR